MIHVHFEASEGFSLLILFYNNFWLRSSVVDCTVCEGRCAEEVSLYYEYKFLWIRSQKDT